MTPKQYNLLVISACAMLLAFIGAALYLTHPRASRDPSDTNPLVGRPNMVDRLVMFDSGRAFVDGRLEHVSVVYGTPSRVVLDDRRPTTFPRYGSWTSPEITTEFGFTELIPSYNATTPPDTGLRIQVRTRGAWSGRWSPWLYLGQWGRTIVASRADAVNLEFSGGMVHIDNLVLDRPADAFQVRVSLQSFDLDRSVNPSIRRISVSYSGQVSDPSRRGALTELVPIDGTWARDLPVPFRAQGDSPRNIRGSICSPTSTTMVMAYWGVDRSHVENALAIYDPQADIFGNWHRAVARASEFGLDGWITRFRTWDQVKSMIARGQPIIAAINFANGEFPSNVMKSTDGHLLVVRGFKPNGDVICNDPASRDKGNGVVYKADELAKAWFTNAGGVGYVIRRPLSGSSLADSAGRGAGR